MEKELEIEVYRSEKGSYHCVVHRGNDSFTDTVAGWVSNDTTGLTPSPHGSVSGCISAALRLINGRLSSENSASSSSEAPQGVSSPAPADHQVAPEAAYFFAKLRLCEKMCVIFPRQKGMPYDIEVVQVDTQGNGVHLLVSSHTGRKRTVRVQFIPGQVAPEITIETAIGIFLGKGEVQMNHKLEKNEAFLRAVRTAKQHLPIQREVCKPEFHVGMTIVFYDGEYRVFDADAWERPSEQPLLPWSPPKGVQVAHVAHDESVTFLENDV